MSSDIQRVAVADANRRRAKHGMAKSSTYNSWKAMKQRCGKGGKYFGRFTVCGRWQNSFENFLEDMGVRPNGMTLDRIDNEKGYTPDNCRWATPTRQANNTRRNITVTLNGEEMSLSRAAERLGLTYSGAYTRLKEKGHL